MDKLTQQDRLDGIDAFVEFMTDHSAQCRMLLNGKHGDEVIDIVGEISQISSKSSMIAFRDANKGDDEAKKDKAVRVVCSAEQLSRLNHRIGEISGDFWTEQSLSLFKLIAGLDLNNLFTTIGRVERDETGKVVFVPDIDAPAEDVTSESIRLEIQKSINLMEANPELGGAAIAKPCRQILSLIHAISQIAGNAKSFEEHQIACEAPAFATTTQAKFAFAVSTYLVSAIGACIASSDRLAATAIGFTSLNRTASDVILSVITPIPSQIDMAEMIHLLCDSAYQDFKATWDIRGEAAGIREAMEKVSKGEMTTEELQKLYGHLKEKDQKIEEEAKFVFSAPASVQ